MGFLNFKKKRKLPADIDLDLPPEPPKMMAKESSTSGPIDEELMVPKAKKSKLPKLKKEKMPELPPLPKIEEHELPPLPKEEELPELPPLPGEYELPPLPELEAKPKKRLFSFLKPKKAKKGKIGEELPELPPLPEIHEMPPKAEKEFPELPPLPEEHELPSLPEVHARAPEMPKLPPIHEEKVPEMRPLLREHEMPAPGPIAPPKDIGKPKPKFITINDFRYIQSSIRSARDMVKGMDGFFSDLDGVKTNRHKRYGEWHNSLKDIQRKIMFVDKTLFEEST